MKKVSFKKVGVTLLTTALVSASLLPTAAQATNNRYRLNNDVNVYMNTIDASTGNNPRARYSAGDYYIYRQLDNYLNISRTPNVAGGWIKTSDNSTTTTTTRNNVTVNSNKLVINSTTPIYMNAYDAMNGNNQRGSFGAGEYYIFREYKGAYNISTKPNVAGGWIYTQNVRQQQTTAPQQRVETQPTQVQQSQTYTLDRSFRGYVNADDARNSRSPRVTLSAGTYYVYREYNGMLNLSTSRNTAGAWVNPNESQQTTTQTTIQTQTRTTPQVASYSSDSSETSTSTSTTGQAIVAEARRYLGYRYVYGAASPSAGFDCSGLTSYVYNKVKGVRLNRSAQAQSYNGTRVSRSNLQPGDLMFFGTSSSNIFHVGIYAGNDRIIHASTPQTGVIESSLSSSWYQRNFQFATRP